MSNYLRLFFSLFAQRGCFYSIRGFMHSLLVCLAELRFSAGFNGFRSSQSLNINTYLLRFLTEVRFLFYFFYVKTNKRLLKFSRYKLPRYSTCYFFIKPNLRIKKLLFIFKKSFLLSYVPQQTFKTNMYFYLQTFLVNPRLWSGLSILGKIHSFIFKKHRRRLFFNHKSISSV